MGLIIFDILDCFFAAESLVNLFYDPSLESLLFATIDTVALLPLIPSSGYARKGAEIVDTVIWDDYRTAHDVGKSSAALGRSFEKWFYEVNRIAKACQQVVIDNCRIDAIFNNCIYELKNYNWSKYSSYSSIISKFLKQASKYMYYLGEQICGQTIYGIVFYFSQEPPAQVLKALEKCGVVVKWA